MRKVTPHKTFVRRNYRILQIENDLFSFCFMSVSSTKATNNNNKSNNSSNDNDGKNKVKIKHDILFSFYGLRFIYLIYYYYYLVCVAARSFNYPHKDGNDMFITIIAGMTPPRNL